MRSEMNVDSYYRKVAMTQNSLYQVLIGEELP